MEKLKFLAIILLACLGSFTLGIYSIITKYDVVTTGSINGEIETFRWIMTGAFTLMFIGMAFSLYNTKK